MEYSKSIPINMNEDWSGSTIISSSSSKSIQHISQTDNTTFQLPVSDLEVDIEIESKSHYPYSNSSTPSPSIPALSRDSVVSNSTRIQTPINRISTSSSSSSSIHSYHQSIYSDPNSFPAYSKMTTAATHPISMSLDSTTSSSINNHHYACTLHDTHPATQHHLAQPYQLAINYMQDHASQYGGYHDQSILQSQQHLGVSGWAPLISPSTINPQLMEPSPSRSLSPESNVSFSPGTFATEEVAMTIAPRSIIMKTSASTSTTDEWYDGPSDWIRSVAEAHKRRRESYLANPKAWPKGEGEPKELQPLTDHCRFPHLWEVEQARKDLTEDAVVAKLMKKSEATITKEFARCQKAGEEFKPPRPMNSAMAFADFRRPQWGDMYSDMKTGSISTWLSAEWRALKDLRPEEFEWWTRVSKKYWDKYVEDYDYKFTRAPNGEGKGSKKRKAKARENAAREKAIRLSNEASRRHSSRSTLMGRRSISTRGSLAPPMNLILPNELQHQQQQYQSFESPNILGLTGIIGNQNQHHLTPNTIITPTNNITHLPYNATGYFDGYTFPLTEGSRTPSPPQLLTPLDNSHSSHGNLPNNHTHTHSPGPYQQNYYYPTQAQMNYAHQQVHQAQQAQQAQHHQQQQQQLSQLQQQHHQQHPQLHINICNTGSYYQTPQTALNTHEYFVSNPTQQTPNHGIGHHIPTLAPHNIPSPQ